MIGLRVRALVRMLTWALPRPGDRDAIYTAVGIDDPAYADGAARLPWDIARELIELAIVQRGEPHFGLHYVDDLGFGTIEALGFLAMACRTIGHAIERVLWFRSDPEDPVEIVLMRDGDVARMRVNCRVPSSPAQTQLVEMHVAAGLTLAPRLARRQLELRSLSLRHRPETSSLATYVRVLGAVPCFGAEHDEWTWPRDTLDLPVPTSNESVSDLLESFLATTQVDSPDLRLRMRNAISRLPPDRVTLETVADAMGIGARTLQRRLRDNGCTFAAVFTEWREVTAKHHLAAGLSSSEVSYLLGFTEPTAFHRAFKRWTGMTPETWRQLHHAGGLRAS